ncbi:MAG: class I SAM-dependent methyltransferase [Propionibacteriaceae bacterium]|nr:class I SAM-dependent methyltransferase [Propionibacteriaceae bacterium]
MDAIARLREDLSRAGYTADKVVEAITDQGQLALTRNHTVAATRALAGRDDPLATLIRLFILQQPQPAPAVAHALDVDSLMRLGILQAHTDGFRAALDIRPYAHEIDQVYGWVVSDHVAELDTRDCPPSPDLVLGVNPASMSLAQITPARQVEGALDLGTGCGIQSLHLAKHASQVVATDLNPRALTLATLTFALNGIEASTKLGSLYEPVAMQSFDMIVTNPPFVIAPQVGQRLTYRETEYPSDEFMKAVIQGAEPRLDPGGSLHIVGNWAHITGQDWRQRVQEWIPQGCDAIMIQREVLDPYEYIEIWLADAGLRGRQEYIQRYDQWLTYFDELKIEAVGMGWLTMVKSGSETPRVITEHWPYAVNDDVADDLMAHLTAMKYADLPDEEILKTGWVLADGTIQESTGTPGEPDPSHIVLRRTDGLGRAHEVSTASGGILGACDGDLPLGTIINAVADLLDQDHQALTSNILAEIRTLICQTWLTAT